MPDQSSPKPEVLIVEDDFAFSQAMLALLEAEGFAATAVNSTGDALELISRRSFPIVISDIYIDERTGLDVLRRARSVEPECAVILITGQGTLDTVLEATRAGAFDYIAKPFPLDRLAQAANNAAQAWAARSSAASAAAEQAAGDAPGQGALIGHSDAMVETYKFISRVADSDATVLLQGETGTGKEMVARLIHASGARRVKRLVVVDCGALPGALLEAELFGASRGAYTGADRDRTGLFEAAEGGTVFLDEIGEMDLGFQQRLLRFLQEREVRPLGTTTARKVDVRVIAATNRDLRALVNEKKFREDLWYRLQVATCQLPPLRARRQDIPELIHHFLARFSRVRGRLLRFDAGALAAARLYDWPGNVRQLENLLERLSILHPGPVVDAAALQQALAAFSPAAAAAPAASGASESLASLEDEHIRRVLESANGNKTRAAEILGIERKTLYRKLEKMRQQSS